MNRPSELSVPYGAVTDMSDNPLPVTSTVSWAAIFAGAAAALSLILLMLGGAGRYSPARQRYRLPVR
ncbi:hypothetical protein [Chitinimonas sp. BJB300]|uniref:hypothetical protein n=1 Tax=Chitinimonas sp. BJB300 TaxID=1559339 RepID=UPI000C11A2BE|nr:hypothetical protein [Chitinimonas sp. BJB300]PHV10027.1 hypothetical protein CSQ89_18420 [Chitinimonas sp. BJB300]TSJ90137.1 hypothetical protein FG002_008135 [Chitinimonas sp. BJB300]